MKNKHLIIGVLLLGVAMFGFAAIQAQPDFATAFIPAPQSTDEPPVGPPTDDLDDDNNNAPPSSAGTPRRGVLADIGTTVIVYPDGDTLVVYGVNDSSVGFVAMTVSLKEISEVPERPTSNTLIKRSAIVDPSDGGYVLYRLTSGELQLNVGPDKEGYIYIIVFDNIYATSYRLTKLNLAG